jgi:3-oxoacyl-[acyl-carrier-protein] synthase II
MMPSDLVITGIGVVSPSGIGKDAFWGSVLAGKDAISAIESFSTEKFSTNLAGEVKNFDPKAYLGPKGLRNLDRTTLFLLVAAKEALEDAKLEITDSNTDDIGVCTGTTFPHLSSIVEFDREVITDGLPFSNPALFPSTVLNAASSQISIKFNIQGFNTTISTGYTSSLEALKYSLVALETDKAKIILSGGAESLARSLFFGFHKLGYMAGIKGEALSCPFDKRRNGPILGEGTALFCLESEKNAKKRKANIYARLRSVANFFDGYRLGKIHPQGEGLEIAIRKALDEAGAKASDIDYICSCANSSKDLDRIEVEVLKKVFGKSLKDIPVSSPKSMFGETISASGALQIATVIAAMKNGVIAPTINYKEKDFDCDIDCVPNKAQKKNVKLALVTSSGPGGYNSACVLEKYNNK